MYLCVSLCICCDGGCYFIIAVFGCGLVYFATGFAYNHARRGLRGREAVPHASFWGDLPLLVRDGAAFAFRKARGGGDGYAAPSGGGGGGAAAQGGAGATANRWGTVGGYGRTTI